MSDSPPRIKDITDNLKGCIFYPISTDSSEKDIVYVGNMPNLASDESKLDKSTYIYLNFAETDKETTESVKELLFENPEWCLWLKLSAHPVHGRVPEGQLKIIKENVESSLEKVLASTELEFICMIKVYTFYNGLVSTIQLKRSDVGFSATLQTQEEIENYEDRSLVSMHDMDEKLKEKIFEIFVASFANKEIPPNCDFLNHGLQNDIKKTIVLHNIPNKYKPPYKSREEIQTQLAELKSKMVRYSEVKSMKNSWVSNGVGRLSITKEQLNVINESGQPVKVLLHIRNKVETPTTPISDVSAGTATTTPTLTPTPSLTPQEGFEILKNFIRNSLKPFEETDTQLDVKNVLSIPPEFPVRSRKPGWFQRIKKSLIGGSTSETDAIKVMCFTWNTQSVEFCGVDHEKSTIEDVKWFSISTNCKKPDFLVDFLSQVYAKNPDIVFVGLQESLKPGSYLMSHTLPYFMHQYGYVTLERTRMMGVGEKATRRGLRSTVFVHSKILSKETETSKIEVSSKTMTCPGIETTIARNKGATITTVKLPEPYNKTLKFVNSHLPIEMKRFKAEYRKNVEFPDEKNKDELAETSIKCFNSIYDAFAKELDVTTTNISVFWLGDMNYRTVFFKDKYPDDFNFENAKDGSWPTYVEEVLKQGIPDQEWMRTYEELTLFRHIRALNGDFKEGINDEGPKFKPTCKMDEGREAEELRYFYGKPGHPEKPFVRAPSWCDRILYTNNDVSTELKCVEYNRYDPKSVAFQMSDHAGVYGVYTIEKLEKLEKANVILPGDIILYKDKKDSIQYKDDDHRIHHAEISNGGSDANHNTPYKLFNEDGSMNKKGLFVTGCGFRFKCHRSKLTRDEDYDQVVRVIRFVGDEGEIGPRISEISAIMMKKRNFGSSFHMCSSVVKKCFAKSGQRIKVLSKEEIENLLSLEGETEVSKETGVFCSEFVALVLMIAFMEKYPDNYHKYFPVNNLEGCKPWSFNELLTHPESRKYWKLIGEIGNWIDEQYIIYPARDFD